MLSAAHCMARKRRRTRRLTRALMPAAGVPVLLGLLASDVRAADRPVADTLRYREVTDTETVLVTPGGSGTILSEHDALIGLLRVGPDSAHAWYEKIVVASIAPAGELRPDLASVHGDLFVLRFDARGHVRTLATPEFPAELEALWARAEAAEPVGPEGTLGTRSNPVLAAGPFGQHEYLARARCPDGATPESERLGSGPSGDDGHILDTYLVRCLPDGPSVLVVMDMYHRHREHESIGPLTVLRELPARMARGCPPQVHPDPDSSAAYVFTEFEVERPAAIIGEGAPPAYEVGIEGSAFVRFVVDTTGAPDPRALTILHVEPARVRRHVPNALARLRFRPAVHHAGCLVRQRIEGPLTFR